MHTACDGLRLFHWLQLDQSLTENAREMEVVEGELEAMEVHCCELTCMPMSCISWAVSVLFRFY